MLSKTAISASMIGFNASSTVIVIVPDVGESLGLLLLVQAASISPISKTINALFMVVLNAAIAPVCPVGNEYNAQRYGVLRWDAE